MCNNDLLATIVHISDLHFGKINAMTGDSDLGNARVPAWFALSHFFSGFLGHHARVLIDFEDYFVNELAQENPIVVVTGDLTATGAREEFDLAMNYLERKVYAGNRFGYVGLNLANIPNSNLFIVGNHDHWPGNYNIWGQPTALYQYFPGPPTGITVTNIPLSNGFKILLAGINTSDEVGPYSVDRIFSRGHFVEQLETLQNTVLKTKANEICVLALHHSLMEDDYIGGISDESRRALEDTIKQLNIKVLLTGHVHTVKGKIFPINYRKNSWRVLEARCGTTFQRDQPTPTLAARQIKKYNNYFNINTFLVHRLYETNGHVKWQTTEYYYDNKGFKKMVQPIKSLMVT